MCKYWLALLFVLLDYNNMVQFMKYLRILELLYIDSRFWIDMKEYLNMSM